MAKAHSPVRLDAGLMDAATASGSMLSRSAAEQIEMWARVGRVICRTLNPSQLMALHAGLLQVKLEAPKPVEINADDIFAELDAARDSGQLQSAIQSGRVRYQASKAVPGMLEQIHPDGRVVVGRFANGQFEAAE